MGKKLVIISLLLFWAFYVAAQQTLNLQGDWTVTIKDNKCDINLPGTLDMAGIGIPTTLAPSLDKQVLRHLTRRVSFIGTADYERTIEIPVEMAGKPLVIKFERVLWRSRLFIDGVEHGSSCESLTTPHIYRLENGLQAGTHVLRVSVDNTKQYDMSYEDMAHAYTNETQTMWNGILGEMSVTALPAVSLEQLQIYPDLAKHEVLVKTAAVRHGETSKKAVLNMQVTTPQGYKMPSKAVKIRLAADTTYIEQTYSLSNNICAWSEFSPSLYKLDTKLIPEKSKEPAYASAQFGMRELSSDKGFLELNGERIFLRGTLECCVFPLTGCPPTTEEGWLTVFLKAKEWGLNHLRFHSYCPPDAAFRVADKMGFYLQVELPNWSLKIGKTPDAEAFQRREMDRILNTYGNHPSFCLMTCGNELQSDFTILNDMVQHAREKDPRHLYAATTFTFEKGHGGNPEPYDQFFVTQWTDKGWVRGQGVFDEQAPDFRSDYSKTASGYDVPLISHEIGQYSVYPNIREIEKYTGTLLPLNFEGIRNDLKEKGLLNRADDYLKASGHLAAILYKEEIERALRTPAFNGYQLLGLQDFPGQSTALVGLVDAFWDSKGVYEPWQFRQFCAPVVPLALYEKATYDHKEHFKAMIEVVNYSDKTLNGKDVLWGIANSKNEIIASDTLHHSIIKKGGLSSIGQIDVPLEGIDHSERLTLSVRINGTPYRNSWHVWVYNLEENLAWDEAIVVTDNVEEAISAAEAGKKVLFSPKAATVDGIEGKFLPVFWSPVHFPKQAGTMGLLPNVNHPALRDFPSEAWSDWQWWSIVKRSRVVCLDSIQGVTPIVESVDNFVNNRRLATVFEGRLGKGMVIVCTADLLTPDKQDGTYKTGITPELLALRKSLLHYMQCDEFQPKGSITPKQLRSLIHTENRQISTSATSIYE